MQRKLRLGVVGCGLAASKLHGTGYKSLDEIDLVACTDRERNFDSKTVPMAEEFGARAYRNIDEMLTDDSIEAIDVCVKEPGHYEIAKKALLAGKHVLCEKALTDDLTSARELEAIAKANKLKFMAVMAGETVSGIHQVVVGTQGGVERVRLDLTMALGAPQPRDEVALAPDGLRLVVPGGTPGERATFWTTLRAAGWVDQM